MRCWIVFPLVFLLASCGFPSGDPASLRAAAVAIEQQTAVALAESQRSAWATQSAATLAAGEMQSVAQATINAQAAQSAQETISAGQAVATLQAGQARVTATSQALDLQQTQIAVAGRDLALRSTQSAATQSAILNRVAFDVTATAIVKQAMRDDYQSQFHSTFLACLPWMVALPLFGFVMAAVSSWWFGRLRKFIIIPSRDGTIWIDEHGPRLLLPAAVAAPAVQVIEAPRSPVENVRLREFVQRAAARVGWHSNEIPRWQGWIGAAAWVEHTDSLESAGWVVKDSQGTRLTGSLTLRDLLVALDESPSPTARSVAFAD